MEMSSIITANKKVSTKFLAVVFGYMFIGLLITAAAALGFAGFVVLNPALSDGSYSLTDLGTTVVLGVGIASIIAAWIDSFVISIISARTGKAPWIGFVLYAVFLGFAISLIFLAGVDFVTVGEAFGLTALCFGIMFLIGYFSPVDLSPFAFVAFALMVGLILVSLFFFVYYLLLLGSGAWAAADQSLFLFDYIVSIVIIVIAMLITGYDANRMGQMVEKGVTNRNIALFCAFSLYCDFITLFVNILYVLLIAKNRR
jgi:FtsH-binding integral membrane protein